MARDNWRDDPIWVEFYGGNWNLQGELAVASYKRYLTRQIKGFPAPDEYGVSDEDGLKKWALDLLVFVVNLIEQEDKPEP